MARPCNSNAFKVSMYSFIRMGMEGIVEEEETDIQVEGRMVTEEALGIYFSVVKRALIVDIIIIYKILLYQFYDFINKI